MGWGNVGFGELSVKCLRFPLCVLSSASAAASPLSGFERVRGLRSVVRMVDIWKLDIRGECAWLIRRIDSVRGRIDEDLLPTGNWCTG